VRVHAGTSGFSYDEWHGRFYPADLPAAARLSSYSARLSSVEINNTFYQTPKAELLERWQAQVPQAFRFALKAPRRITHMQRLRGTTDSLGYFWSAASALGDQLGPVLFQLPPFARKDGPLLAEFLASLPAELKPAFEFRHESWFDDEVYALLAGRNAALCAGDAEDGDRSPPLVATADFGYLRLRSPSYDAARLREWSEKIREQRWSDAYVYLKHEVLGPDYALFLAAIAEGKPEPPFPEPLTEPVPVGAVDKKRAAKKAAAKKAAAEAKAPATNESKTRPKATSASNAKPSQKRKVR
jgi:uncharacterized protein YecE (DUF72 family)